MKFEKPSIEQLAEYAAQIGYRSFNAERFFDYYEACGWLVGKGKPMKDWRAAVRNWRRMDIERGKEERTETDPVILDYARQAKAILDAGGYEIGRFWAKVRNAIGEDGLKRVMSLARRRE